MQLALQHCCKSNVARLPPKFKPVNNLICEKTGSLLVKMCNIATQLVLQQCCKTSCTFLVGCFTVHLRMIWLILLTHSLNSMFTVMIVMTVKLYEKNFLN